MLKKTVLNKGSLDSIPKLPRGCWEAVENVGSVLANLLKVQSRMEVVRDKLGEIKSSESERSPSNNNTCSTHCHFQHVYQQVQTNFDNGMLF